MSRVRRAVPLVAAGLLLAGCGVTTQQSPDVISRRSVPFQLLDEPAADAPASTLPATPERRAESVAVFFLDGEALVATERSGIGTPADLLRDLLRGPTTREAAAGLRTAIPPGTTIRGTRLRDDGTLIIDLGRAFLRAGGSQQDLAIAQFVFSATSLTGVDAVRFAVAGERAEVPLPNGILTNAPLARSDVTP